MKTIVLDTSELAQMVSLVAQANDEIDEAADLMNKVTSHNDWTCRERTLISDGVQRCKKSICLLQDSTRVFLNAFNQVLDDMVKKENGIAKTFQGVESVLAKILSAGLATSGIGGAITGIVKHGAGSIVSDILSASDCKTSAADWPAAKAANSMTAISEKAWNVSSVIDRNTVDAIFRDCETISGANCGDISRLFPGAASICHDSFGLAGLGESIPLVDFQTLLDGMNEN